MRSSIVLSFLVAGCAAAPAPKKEPPKQAPLVESSGVDESALDRAVNPCDDFFEYACGSWLKRTEIPADKSTWGRSFSEIDLSNENALHAILDDVAAGKSIAPDPYGDKLGDFYSACMDETTLESAAPAALKALLARVDKVDGAAALARELAVSHLESNSWQPLFEPVHALFRLSAGQDFKDATKVIGIVGQSGLGLPDRDSYLKKDPKSLELRAAYSAHVTQMLTLAGVPAAAAKTQAATVLQLEEKLAQASMSRVDRRDPNKVYHRMTVADLEKLAPRFPWKVYLGALGHPGITQLNVEEPDYFAALGKLVEKTPPAELRAYLRWWTLHLNANGLGKAFIEENFHFYDKTLNGVAELEPRWKRCVKATDTALGEALARPFVRKALGTEGKATTQEMVGTIERAMGADLAKLGWMDDASRAAAQEKLAAIVNKIGFPDRWRNYDALSVTRQSFIGNAHAASTFERHRDLTKIGQPLDRNEWQMTPPTVNAYYDSSMNEMVFPAGILQPPFFSRTATAAVNYGGIGMVMGHELTHGFDDEGRQFDAKGNLHVWWTPSVTKDFVARAACVAEQFDGYTVGDQHLNGKLTLGENIADLGGIKLAHAAFVAAHANDAPKSGFTGEQAFFLGFAQGWCAKRRPEAERVRVMTDPHSPPRYRVDGPLSNLPEFAAAFQCKAGQKMVSAKACTVW